MHKKLYQEAEKCFHSAVSQYEASVGPECLLTIEAQLYHASNKCFTNVSEALEVLKCAESRLDSISQTDHFLSAKVSYNIALLYQKSGNRKKAQVYMTNTLRKIHNYGGKLHPWSADIMNWLEKQEEQVIIPVYHMCAREMYRELIQRETSESKVLAVDVEAAVFIQQWNKKL